VSNRLPIATMAPAPPSDISRCVHGFVLRPRHKGQALISNICSSLKGILTCLGCVLRACLSRLDDLRPLRIDRWRSGAGETRSARDICDACYCHKYDCRNAVWRGHIARCNERCAKVRGL
jgi:hypothetical protein